MAENDLSRIAALSDRLAPLTDKSRGMRIEAAEWNALVATLRGILEVDRLQEIAVFSGLDQQFARKAHEHIGEVRLDWLDPSLQAALGGRGDAGGGSVATRTALADMDRKIDALGAAVAKLTERIETLQRQLDRSAVNEFDRDRKLRTFDDRLSAVDSLRTLVTDSVTDINGIKRSIDDVLKLRQSLTDPAGQPIDVAGLRDKVAGLDALRDNMLGADGQPLRLRDIELKIKDIDDIVGVGAAGGLDKRLGELSAALETKLDAKSAQRTDTLAAALRDEQARAGARTATDLNAALDAAKTSIAGTVDQRVAALQNDVNRRVDERTKTAGDALKQELSQTFTAQIDTKFADIPRQVKTSVDAARVASEAVLLDKLSGQITTNLQTQVQQVETRLADRVQQAAVGIRAEAKAQLDASTIQLRGEIGQAVDAATAKNTTALNAQATLLRSEIAASRADILNLAADRAKSLFDTSRGDLLKTVDERIATSATTLQRTIDTKIADSRRDRPILIDRGGISPIGPG